jgi:hypothetical protein
MTFNFNIFQYFSNIRNHLSNFSYLVCISCKIFISRRFYLLLKTENSRRVAESRLVCAVIQLVPVERPKTNEKFSSREKIRKWKTGITRGQRSATRGSGKIQTG